MTKVMKACKAVWGGVAAALAVLLLASPVSAQIQLGVGMGAPIVGNYIPTTGHVDSAGVVTIDSTLDSSPQIVVEVHKTFKVHEKLGIGPYLGFAPKVDFGTASNSQSESPIGAGMGFLVSTSAGGKHRLNIGLMWLITGPVVRVNPAWRDGYQAPRSLQGIPLDIRTERSSANRVMLTFTMSGMF